MVFFYKADEVRQPRKNFQRRQIVSNWQKYEVQPENEEQQEARGKSFENLLSMSGNLILLYDIEHLRYTYNLAADDQDGILRGKTIFFYLYLYILYKGFYI